MTLGPQDESNGAKPPNTDTGLGHILFYTKAIFLRIFNFLNSKFYLCINLCLIIYFIAQFEIVTFLTNLTEYF